MAEQGIVPIAPNMGGQEAAIAGSQAVAFTATDREIIEKRSGKINKNRHFIDLFKERPLTPEVENEETNVKPQQNIRGLDGHQQAQLQVLKNSTAYEPKERVNLSNELPDKFAKNKPTKVKPDPEDTSQNNKDIPETEKKPGKNTRIHEKTAALAKEIKLNPAEILDKFTLEQEELHSLIYRIKELHLKRLFTNDKNEFDKLSKEIISASLRSVKPEAKNWLKAKLNLLTLEAAKYKLGIFKALQSMDYNQERKDTIHWLEKIIGQLSKTS